MVWSFPQRPILSVSQYIQISHVETVCPLSPPLRPPRIKKLRSCRPRRCCCKISFDPRSITVIVSKKENALKKNQL